MTSAQISGNMGALTLPNVPLHPRLLRDLVQLPPFDLVLLGQFCQLAVRGVLQ